MWIRKEDAAIMIRLRVLLGSRGKGMPWFWRIRSQVRCQFTRMLQIGCVKPLKKVLALSWEVIFELLYVIWRILGLDNMVLALQSFNFLVGHLQFCWKMHGDPRCAFISGVTLPSSSKMKLSRGSSASLLDGSSAQADYGSTV